jgi:hypothetical protein
MCVALEPTTVLQSEKKGTYPSTFDTETIGFVGSKGYESDTQKLLNKQTSAMNYYKNHNSSALGHYTYYATLFHEQFQQHHP